MPRPIGSSSIKDATYPNGAFAAMRDEVRSLDVGAYAEGHSFTLTGSGEPDTSDGHAGVRRTLLHPRRSAVAGPLAAPRRRCVAAGSVVAISHALWLNQFHRDPAIVGRSILLDGVSREVVAVMPPSSSFRRLARRSGFRWASIPATPPGTWAGDYMPIVGRLQPGNDGERAHGRQLQSRIGARFPWRMPDAWNRTLRSFRCRKQRSATSGRSF